MNCEFLYLKTFFVVMKDILRDLHLPKENTLFLLTPGSTHPHPATSDG